MLGINIYGTLPILQLSRVIPNDKDDDDNDDNDDDDDDYDDDDDDD